MKYLPNSYEVVEKLAEYFESITFAMMDIDNKFFWLSVAERNQTNKLNWVSNKNETMPFIVLLMVNNPAD